LMDSELLSINDMGGDFHVILSRGIYLLWNVFSGADGTTQNSMGWQSQTSGREVNFRAPCNLCIDAQVNALTNIGARSEGQMVAKMIWQR
jgi:hypothetical protein